MVIYEPDRASGELYVEVDGTPAHLTRGHGLKLSPSQAAELAGLVSIMGLGELAGYIRQAVQTITISMESYSMSMAMWADLQLAQATLQK